MYGYCIYKYILGCKTGLKSDKLIRNVEMNSRHKNL